MYLCLIGHDFRYELEKLVRIFMPFEKITFEDKDCGQGIRAVTFLEKGNTETKLSACLYLEDVHYSDFTVLENSHRDYEKECERLLAVSLYNCFVSATGYVPQWGILTGVRPAKLYSRLVKQMGKADAEDWFKNALMVSDKKLALCRTTQKSEGKITDLSRPDSFSLYISVPFCPTRCSYCSFVSHSVEQAKKLIPDYVNTLCEEIALTGKIANTLRLNLETVYIGGGTPTTLSAEQLEKVMNTVKQSFDLTNLREYTVEAGRPDTVTRERLLAIKNGGATRISINPQTMNDAVLSEIGRRHTAGQTVEAFKLARSCGFNNINMDLIAGLPTDTLESFKDTVQKVLELDCESVTVHSLSMKRSSNLSIGGNFPETKTGEVAGKMVDFANERLAERGIVPYYMYRQSKTVGNLENVGYSKKGFECLYNVYIMDETHTILACGASAVTKLREPKGDYIERIFNFKYPYEYLSRFDELKERKNGVYNFYKKFKEEN